MIQYTFPALVRDACVMGVAPVLRQALAVTLSENKTPKESMRYLATLLEKAPNRENLSSIFTEKEFHSDRIDIPNLFYLLFQQEYTGYERDPNVEGALAFLSEHYDISAEQKDMLWMTQHIYQQAMENLKDKSQTSDNPSFSTWTDERALDVMQQAIAPFGENVAAFFAPFTTSLEVQTDMRRADLGDANAMLEVAFDLIEGRGVTVDFTQAERWAREAIEKGTSRSDEAQKMLDFLLIFNERR